MDKAWTEGSHTNYGLGRQLADMLPQIEDALLKVKPDKVFILGDTNSALCSIIAERMGIPVYHMEAANRSFNREIPEEINRMLIDRISSYNLFYTDTNRHTLLREGADPKKIFQCGNPTLEVLNYYKDNIDRSPILSKLQLKPYGYFLVDIHRTENVENTDRLRNILSALNLAAEHYMLPIICSVHPKTQTKMENTTLDFHKKIVFLDSFGFFDFVKLEKHAKVGLTDSGLCSEEYCLLNRPCVIVRNETERPEVIEEGGAIISGTDSEEIFRCIRIMERASWWGIPDGYDDFNVSDKVVNYILSKSQ